MGKKINTKINEVTIKLLPEKEKRDYILRMIAFIIVMFFIILNFFITFMPRINLISEVNKINRGNYYLDSKYYDLLEKFNNVDIEVVINGKKQKLYDVDKNKDAIKMAYGQLDLIEVVKNLSTKLSPSLNQYLENIRYDASTNQVTITLLFSTYNDVVLYSHKLNELTYFKDIKLLSSTSVPTNEGVNRERAIFTITLDNNLAPKVGEIDD